VFSVTCVIIETNITNIIDRYVYLFIFLYNNLLMFSFIIVFYLNIEFAENEIDSLNKMNKNHNNYIDNINIILMVIAIGNLFYRLGLFIEVISQFIILPVIFVFLIICVILVHKL